MSNWPCQELARTIRGITISGALTHWDRVKMRFLQTTFIQYNIFNEYDRICITISLNLSPGGPFDNLPTLVRIVAWCRSGNTPLFEPFWCNSRMQTYITRSHWVKAICLIYTVSSLSARPNFQQNKDYFYFGHACICLNAYYDSHIRDEKRASVPTANRAEKSGYFVFPAFCFLCHHYSIRGFRISTCVIWAILVMCLLLSTPEYVWMQLYRQPPEQKVWISTFCSFVSNE